MTNTLQYQPGQTVSIVLEVLNIDGYRSDSSTLPVVQRIILPNLTLAASYPKNMIKIDTGLYYFNFVLPSGSTAVGTYIVDVSWLDPDFVALRQTTYQVIVNASFGQYTISTV